MEWAGPRGRGRRRFSTLGTTQSALRRPDKEKLHKGKVVCHEEKSRKVVSYFKNVYSMKLVSQVGVFSVGIGPIRLKLSGEVVGEVR
jgi:hypothetical protein